MPEFTIVAALDQERGIGKEGTLPWNIPEDLNYFHELTKRRDNSAHINAVIMGRKTWESLPVAERPLEGRINVVMTRSPNYVFPEGVIQAHSWSEALERVEKIEQLAKIFVIGGGQVYKEAIEDFNCVRLYLTHIHSNFNCDIFFPEYETTFQLLSKSDTRQQNGLQYSFNEYCRRL
jgi:dihydrofolate reductase/thymidylate synthase